MGYPADRVTTMKGLYRTCINQAHGNAISEMTDGECNACSAGAVAAGGVVVPTRNRRHLQAHLQ